MRERGGTGREGKRGERKGRERERERGGAEREEKRGERKGRGRERKGKRGKSLKIVSPKINIV